MKRQILLWIGFGVFGTLLSLTPALGQVSSEVQTAVDRVDQLNQQILEMFRSEPRDWTFQRKEKNLQPLRDQRNAQFSRVTPKDSMSADDRAIVEAARKRSLDLEIEIVRFRLQRLREDRAQPPFPGSSEAFLDLSRFWTGTASGAIEANGRSFVRTGASFDSLRGEAGQNSRHEFDRNQDIRLMEERLHQLLQLNETGSRPNCAEVLSSPEGSPLSVFLNGR